jgi:hypothetical protein
MNAGPAADTWFFAAHRRSSGIKRGKTLLIELIVSVVRMATKGIAWRWTILGVSRLTLAAPVYGEQINIGTNKVSLCIYFPF